MKKTTITIALLSLLTAACLLDTGENAIIPPGCDAPPTDPNRVCEGNGGGGTGGIPGTGTGGTIPRPLPCPNPAHVRYPDGLCALPPGALCHDPLGEYPFGSCRINDAGWCACPGD